MLVRMGMTMDTLWANKLQITVSVELDNPHLLTTRELSTLMIRNLQTMVEEARAANEQAIVDGPGRAGSEQNRRGELGNAARGE